MTICGFKKAHRCSPGCEPSLLPAMRVHCTDTHVPQLHPNHRSLHLRVITNTHASPVGASREPRRIHLPKPEEQDRVGLQAVSSHRSESALSSPACPG